MGGAPFESELAYKVAHACVASERITEEEELAVFRVSLCDG